MDEKLTGSVKRYVKNEVAGKKIILENDLRSTAFAIDLGELHREIRKDYTFS